MSVQKMVPLDALAREFLRASPPDVDSLVVDAIPVADMREAWECPHGEILATRDDSYCSPLRRVLIADHPEEAS